MNEVYARLHAAECSTQSAAYWETRCRTAWDRLRELTDLVRDQLVPIVEMSDEANDPGADLYVVMHFVKEALRSTPCARLTQETPERSETAAGLGQTTAGVGAAASAREGAVDEPSPLADRDSEESAVRSGPNASLANDEWEGDIELLVQGTLATVDGDDAFVTLSTGEVVESPFPEDAPRATPSSGAISSDELNARAWLNTWQLDPDGQNLAGHVGGGRGPRRRPGVSTPPSCASNPRGCDAYPEGEHVKKHVIPKKVYLLFDRADGFFALDTYRSRAKAELDRLDEIARFGGDWVIVTYVVAP